MRYVCNCGEDFRELGRTLQNAWKPAALDLLDPVVRMGAALCLLRFCLLTVNILSPAPYARDPNTGLPVLNGGMALWQQPLDATSYLIILVVFTCWLQIRFRSGVLQCGLAAAKITLLAGVPAAVASLLIISGVLRVIVLGPGDAPTFVQEHGFALTYYSADPHVLAAGRLLFSAVVGVPMAFFWGAVGGLLGRGITAPGRRSSPQPV